MDPDINKILSEINAEIQRLATEASDIIDAINYIKEASEAHEKGVHLLGSYIKDLTKALSINTVPVCTSPMNTGSSSGPLRDYKPISDTAPTQTISIEVDSPKISPTKKFIQIDSPYTEEKEEPLNQKE